MKIALGSTSGQKQRYITEVIDDIGIKAQLIPVDVKSEVSDQPGTASETKKGALNRARSAFEKESKADFGLGVEVGYHKGKNRLAMFCCAAIVDGNGFSESCFSSKFPLPTYHREILKQGKYLSEHVKEYEKDIDEPVVNYVRELVRGRKPLIIEATRNILLHYLNKY